MREIILDTETTGLDPKAGHKIIEIGCLELIDRQVTGNNFHIYINPERDIEEEAVKVHGITSEFLKDKPIFKDVVGEFLAFIKDSVIIIHNAPFDVGFLNHEMQAVKKSYGTIRDYSEVIDTLVMARKMHPGQRNSLDALCKRYGVDNSDRQLHGALLDAELLAFVYLAMTGGQTSLFGGDDDTHAHSHSEQVIQHKERPELPVVFATAEEITMHEAVMQKISS